MAIVLEQDVFYILDDNVASRVCGIDELDGYGSNLFVFFLHRADPEQASGLA